MPSHLAVQSTCKASNAVDYTLHKHSQLMCCIFIRIVVFDGVLDGGQDGGRNGIRQLVIVTNTGALRPQEGKGDSKLDK